MIDRSNHCRPRPRHGYALLVVMIVILTTTALAAVHQRELNSALRIEQARVESERHAQGPLRVLAVAVDRLKTGNPPAPVSYSYDHVVGSSVQVFRVDYAVAGTSWTVSAHPDSSAGTLPPLPDSF